MARLDDRIKTRIVQALACYDAPAQVAAAVKDEFGVAVTRQQVQCYDPDKAAGHALAKRWRDLFSVTREAFLRDAASVPIANRSYRLRALQRLYEQVSNRGNAVLAAAALEQAAKEVGGVFTNRREHSGPVGGPIRTDSVHRLSDAELERIAAGAEGLPLRQPAGCY